MMKLLKNVSYNDGHLFILFKLIILLHQHDVRVNYKYFNLIYCMKYKNNCHFNKECENNINE